MVIESVSHSKLAPIMVNVHKEDQLSEGGHLVVGMMRFVSPGVTVLTFTNL